MSSLISGAASLVPPPTHVVCGVQTAKQPAQHEAAAGKIRELLLGRPLRSDEEPKQRIGTLTGLPAVGLDALASAAYGPEAALTVLLPLGLAATRHIVPITGAIVLLLLTVVF